MLKELDVMIFRDGYMKRQYAFYIYLSLFIFAGLAGSVVGIIFVQGVFLQLLMVGLFTFFRVQAGFLGHDFSHNQVFFRKKLNLIPGYIIWCLIAGLSQDYWMSKHNKHHNHTNQHESDPDLDIPFIISPEQMHSKNPLVKKYIAPYQHILFFLLVPFLYFSMVFESLKFIWQTKRLAGLMELGLMILSFVGVFWVWIYFQGLALGLFYVFLHLLLAGTYLGAVFGTNHLGKEVIQKWEKYVRINQVVTSRNIKTSLLGFHFFGGLDYQVEHHLYPSMPRINYRKVGPLVKLYCKEKNIPYDENSWIRAVGEIYTTLKWNRM